MNRRTFLAAMGRACALAAFISITPRTGRGSTGHPMPSEYEAAHMKYRELAKKAAGGDKQAFQDKAKAMGEIRQIEREAARAGTILSAQYRGDKVVTEQKRTHKKSSLQEEWTRKFDEKVTVEIKDKNGNVREQTLQEYHAKRLGLTD